MPNNYLNLAAAYPGMGARDSINKALEWCAITNGSTVEEANFRAFEAMKLDSLVRVPMRMASSLAGYTWHLAPKVSRADMADILEALENADEWMIDDSYLAEVEGELEDDYREAWAKEIDVPVEYLSETLYELDLNITVEYDRSVYIYYSTPEEREETRAKVEQMAKEKASIWSAHYAIDESAKHHYPEHCYYCRRAETGAY